MIGPYDVIARLVADDVDSRLANRFPLPKKKIPAADRLEEIGKKYSDGEIADVRVLANTQPAAVHAIPITILPTAMTSRSISLQDNQSQASSRSEEFQVHLDIS